jgi:hypothetical protein
MVNCLYIQQRSTLGDRSVRGRDQMLLVGLHRLIGKARIIVCQANLNGPSD